MADTPTGKLPYARWISGAPLCFVLVVLVVLGVAVSSRFELITILYDGLRAAMVVVPPMLAGLWLVPVLRLGSLPVRWHILLGSALGLGLFSLALLLFGVVGFFARPVWIAMFVVLAVAGAVRLRTLLMPESDEQASRPKAAALKNRWGLLWLLACPFAILALLAASNAPGFIWQEEGFGYDVLEYHLQVPKEYYEAGAIQYLPHNVYASFPANVEMLYLAAMIVHDDVADIGCAANMIHLGLAVLTVFAAWVVGREWSVAAGHVCGVAMATAGWLAYLCGLAYVENGMLFFGLAATGLVLRCVRGSEGAQRSGVDSPTAAGHTGRTLGAAGLLAGFACGCKYTAVALIAGPLWLVVLGFCGRSMRQRVRAALVFLIGNVLAFSPWLVKNVLATGNPVFPLANEFFDAHPPGWGEAETQAWNRGHALRESERGVMNRLRTAWMRTAGDRYQRFGPGIFMLAIAGLAWRRRDSRDYALVALLGVQFMVWILATHLFARFAVVLLIPLAILCGRSVVGTSGQIRDRAIAVLFVLAGGWNVVFAAGLHRRESPGGAPPSLIYDGDLAGYEYFRAVNHELPADARVLLVGDARAFYFQRSVDYCVAFNRNPFLIEVASTDSASQLMGWLRERGYSHVLVNWAEVRRLASTYGFSPPTSEATLVDVFRRLEEGSMNLVRTYSAESTRKRYVDLYELPD